MPQQRFRPGLNHNLERTCTHRLANMPADRGAVGAAEAAVHMRVWLAVEEADGALQGANFQCATESNPAFGGLADLRAQLDFLDCAKSVHDCGIDIVLSCERRETAHQLLTRFEHDHEALRTFSYLHGRAL